MPLPAVAAAAVVGMGALAGKLALVGLTVGLTLLVVVVADVEAWAWRGMDWVMTNFMPTIGVSGFSASSLPPSFWWLADKFQLFEGLSLLFSALLCRFMIRRLPVIG